MLRRFLPLVIVGICLNLTLSDIGANLPQSEGDNPQKAVRNAHPCGGYDQPICGSPEAAGAQPDINGVTRNSGYWHRMSYLQQPRSDSLVTPRIMVSADLLPAVAESKKALENFYSRMVRDYGGCTWDGKRPWYGCEEGAILLKKMQAAFMRNGGAAIRKGYAAGYLDASKNLPAGRLDALHTTVNVNLYWLDQFSRGKATLAFQDNNLGLDTIKRYEDETRKDFDLEIDRVAHSDVLELSKGNCPEKDQACEDFHMQHGDSAGCPDRDKPCEDRLSAAYEASERESKFTNGHPIGSEFTRSMLWAPGPPVSVPSPKIRLYAKCAGGLQFIDEIYLGVPTIVTAEFDPPFERYTYDVEVSVGSRKVKMTAHRFDSHGRLFRTEPFIPTEAKADVGPIFDPPVPPDPNRSRP
jgi:hypothetical protein